MRMPQFVSCLNQGRTKAARLLLPTFADSAQEQLSEGSCIVEQ